MFGYKQVYILGNVFPILSISLLYPKESFLSNVKTTRKKRFFNGATANWFLLCYYVNKIILFQLINK